ICVRIVAAAGKSSTDQSASAQSKKSEQSGIQTAVAHQLVDRSYFAELEIGQTLAVLTQPERSIVIFENQLAVLAVLNNIEILDPDRLTVAQVDDQIFPFTRKQSNIPRME